MIDKEKGKYQIICTLRLGGLNFLTILLSDFHQGCLVAVKLFSPNDKINWEWDTSRYPKELITYLQSHTPLINAGYYDLRTWEMTIWDQKENPAFKDLTPFNTENSQEGSKRLRVLLENQLKDVLINENTFTLEDFPSFKDYKLQTIQKKFIKTITTETELVFKLYKDNHIKIPQGTTLALNLYSKHCNLLDADGKIHSMRFKEIIGLDDILKE
ncbi:hypothetical protein Q0O85_19340 [Priestia megaterium]|uniref:hypothetical protein n=1 Tax=Priestia megaterium TaxID=1404 RepID=UPI00345A0F36